MQKPARSKGVNEVALTSCGLLHLLTQMINLYWFNFVLLRYKKPEDSLSNLPAFLLCKTKLSE